MPDDSGRPTLDDVAEGRAAGRHVTVVGDPPDPPGPAPTDIGFSVGAGPPDPTDASVDDYYLDVAGGIYYGPKTASQSDPWATQTAIGAAGRPTYLAPEGTEQPDEPEGAPAGSLILQPTPSGGLNIWEVTD